MGTDGKDNSSEDAIQAAQEALRRAYLFARTQEITRAEELHNGVEVQESTGSLPMVGRARQSATARRDLTTFSSWTGAACAAVRAAFAMQHASVTASSSLLVHAADISLHLVEEVSDLTLEAIRAIESAAAASARPVLSVISWPAASDGA